MRRASPPSCCPAPRPAGRCGRSTRTRLRPVRFVRHEPEPPPPSPTAAAIHAADHRDRRRFRRAPGFAGHVHPASPEAGPPPDGEGLLRRAEADRAKLADVLRATAIIRNRHDPIDGDGAPVASSTGRGRRGGMAQPRPRPGPDRGRSRPPLPFSGSPCDPAGNLSGIRPARADHRTTTQMFRPRAVTVLARRRRRSSTISAQGHLRQSRIDSRPQCSPIRPRHGRHHTWPPRLRWPLTVRGPSSGPARDATGIDPATIRSFIYAEPATRIRPRRWRRSAGRWRGSRASARARPRGHGARRRRKPAAVRRGHRTRSATSWCLGTLFHRRRPGVRAYYANRNLFGGGESFRWTPTSTIWASATTPSPTSARLRESHERPRRTSLATYVQPALWGTRNDLLANAFITREVQQSYLVMAAVSLGRSATASRTRSRRRSGSTPRRAGRRMPSAPSITG